MSNLNGDYHSRILKMAGRLEKEIIVALLRPYSDIVEKYFGLPVTPNDVENWDYPIYGMYRLILSGELPPDILHLLLLLSYISKESEFDAFKNEFYRLFGLKKILENPAMRYAGRVAQLWIQSSEPERIQLLKSWSILVASKIVKNVVYSFFPTSTLFSSEQASDPLRQQDFLRNLSEELIQKRAIPKGTTVMHKRIKDEDWFWFVLCAQNGKVCMSCCCHPGVVVYNRKHGLLRTSNIKRDVHHLSCVIHSFGTAYFGDGEAFVTMNKKLTKHFNIWGVQRHLGEHEGAGRPELTSMSYSTYDTSDTLVNCGNGRDGVKTLCETEEVGYVHRATFMMTLLNSGGNVGRKQFTVYAGNKIEFQCDSEEDRVLDWLVKIKIVKVGKERDSDPVHCGDIAKRVHWMEKEGILGKPRSLWQFKELFGDYFERISSHLVPSTDAEKTDHFRERNGASTTVPGGNAAGKLLWEGRVGEGDFIPFDERELTPYALSHRGQTVAKTLESDRPPVTKVRGGKKPGDNIAGADKQELILEIEKRMGPEMTCNAACEAVCKKLKLKIDGKSLARQYRRWMAKPK